MSKPFHLMAKPVSYQCNIACDYCFYLEKEQSTLKPRKPARHMDDVTLEAYVRQYIEANPAQRWNLPGREVNQRLPVLLSTKRRCSCRANMPGRSVSVTASRPMAC